MATDVEETRNSGTATDYDTEKNNADNVNKAVESDGGSEFKQDGVRAVEAITSVWSKKMLWVTFALLFLVTFVDMLLQSVQSNLIAYVTSSFAQHGLLATTGIVAAVVGGVTKLAIAKIIDIWGRVEGLAAMLILIVVGMIMKATCTNVETYAAAHTLYWVGHLGLVYIIDVVIADMTTLKNRAIMFGINATPTVATTFAGPRIAELFYVHANFRWAFGAFCIILVAFCIPVAVIFFLNRRKSLSMGIAQKPPSGRSPWESVKHYFVELDVVGMLLTVAGWSLLLLPFNLASTAPNGWSTDYIIAMIVVGVVLIGVFVAWEKFFATVPYFPFRFLKDRTILGASMLYGLMFASIFCWDTYYQSYLQVVHNQSITHSGYILNAFSLTSAFIGPFVGLIMRYTGEYKWLGLSGVPFVVLGTVLLIHFRTPESEVGYLVMCQVFNGIGTGIWSITGQMGVMAAVNHQEVAVALALYSMFGSIGSGIGQAVAGSLWTNVLPEELYSRLPADAKDQTATIYGDIVTQMSYPMGSEVRDAIIAAYGDVQRKMVIAGSAFLPILVVCVVMWKNVNLKQKANESGQPKGNVW